MDSLAPWVRRVECVPSEGESRVRVVLNTDRIQVASDINSLSDLFPVGSILVINHELFGGACGSPIPADGTLKDDEDLTIEEQIEAYINQRA